VSAHGSLFGSSFESMAKLPRGLARRHFGRSAAATTRDRAGQSDGGQLHGAGRWIDLDHAVIVDHRDGSIDIDEVLRRFSVPSQVER